MLLEIETKLKFMEKYSDDIQLDAKELSIYLNKYINVDKDLGRKQAVLTQLASICTLQNKDLDLLFSSKEEVLTIGEIKDLEQKIKNLGLLRTFLNNSIFFLQAFKAPQTLVIPRTVEKKLFEEQLITKELVLKESLVKHIDELRMVFFRKVTKHFIQKIEVLSSEHKEYLLGLISQFDHSPKEYFYQQYISQIRGVTLKKSRNNCLYGKGLNPEF